MKTRSNKHTEEELVAAETLEQLLDFHRKNSINYQKCRI